MYVLTAVVAPYNMPNSSTVFYPPPSSLLTCLSAVLVHLNLLIIFFCHFYIQYKVCLATV